MNTNLKAALLTAAAVVIFALPIYALLTWPRVTSYVILTLVAALTIGYLFTRIKDALED